jgi:hypothetical protein
MAAAVEHQRHETAANHERENDAEDHGYVAMDAYLHVNSADLCRHSHGGCCRTSAP